MARERTIVRVAWLVLLLLAAACGPRITPETVGTFATALDRTSSGVGDAFSAVDKLGQDARVDFQAVSYANDVRAGMVTARQAVIPPALLQPRLQVLAGLEVYATALNALVDGGRATELSAAIGKVGEELSGLSQNEYLPVAVEIPPERLESYRSTLAMGIPAVQALGNRLVDWHVQKGVGQAAKEMQPHIERVAELLAADLDLLSLLAENQIERFETQAIVLLRASDMGGLTPIERFDAYKRIAGDIEGRRAVQAGIERAKRTLGKLTTAHAALANPQQRASLREVQSFLEDATTIAVFFRQAALRS